MQSRSKALLHVVVAVSSLAWGCESSGAICSEEALAAAASRAGVVSIGDCVVPIAGTIRIASGARVVGTTATSGLDLAPTGRLEATCDPDTGLEDLVITSDTHRPAVLAREGTGGCTLRGLDVSVTRGIGVAGFRTSSMTVEDVVVRGPVTAATFDALGDRFDATSTGIHGVALVEVGTAATPATLRNVEISGFASSGATFTLGHTRWEGGRVSATFGVGVYVSGGRAEVLDVAVEGTAGQGSLFQGYGVLVADAAEVDADGVAVSGTDGYGVVVDGSSVRFVDAAVTANRQVGIWSQFSDAIAIAGASTIAENGGAGLMALRTRAVTIEGATIRSTVERTRVDGESGRLDIGDGVQSIGGTALVMRDVQMEMNSRIGLLVDLDGEALTADVSGVVVDGDSLGAVVQGGTPPAGWDSGISRLGATAANDAALTVALGSVRTGLTIPDVAAGLAGAIGMPE